MNYLIKNLKLNIYIYIFFNVILDLLEKRVKKKTQLDSHSK